MNGVSASQAGQQDGFSPKCVLVTGGAGFIGSNFIRHVLARTGETGGTRIINLDCLTYAGNLENLADVTADEPRYVFARADICETATVVALCHRHGVDAIVNFAAESHVDRSIEGAAPFIRTNVQGTLSLLEAARSCGNLRFLQVGTDEVYGSLGNEGLFSELTPLDPHSPYSASKAAADHLVSAFGTTYGLPVLITRCSNNYGPYQFPEKMIPLMINNARLDRPLPVYGDGRNVRDWLYVEDHCSAIWAALTKGRPGRTYNIGGSSERRNIDVVKAILRMMNKPESLITFVKDRPGHDYRYAIDCSRIESELGWRRTVTFEDGLQRTIQWYISNDAWLDRVTSGAYRDYYNRMYGSNG
ncbi:MAG: dTDP-glucose 4,6-dehydratase [Phycisphaerae bacterium]|nr:dTDP-glucose 4,6-dehydratase [Phycisphaerae bacterium]